MRITIAFVLVLGLASCTKANPDRCCNDAVDCNAQGLPLGSVCDDGLVCRGDQCIAETCVTAAECDAALPYCVMELCAASCTDDSQCPGNAEDASDTYCVGGSCVTCRDSSECGSATPVCDTGVCRGCKLDAECPSEVCDTDSGLCIAETTVAYVSPTGSDTATCTKADQCSLQQASVIVDVTRNVIKLAPGLHTSAPYGFSNTVTIYGASASIQSGIGVGGATLRIRDADLMNPIVCAPSTVGGPMPMVDLERVTSSVGLNKVQGQPCAIRISHSTLHTPTNVGIAVYAVGEVAGIGGATANRGSTVTIDSSVIDGAGTAVGLSNYSSVQIVNSVFSNQGTKAIGMDSTTQSSTVMFSTFYNSLLSCPTGANSLASSNNIFLNDQPSPPADIVSGTACSHSYDLIKPQSTAVSGANILNEDPRFVDPTNGDYHLMVGSPAIDAADPTATEAIDYDGTTRPQGAGRDLGAFEYH